MSDYIKREDAIEYLVDNMTWMDADGIETSEEDKREAIAELIKGVPSADAVPMGDYMELHNHFVNWQPVRRGKWVVAGNTTHYYVCSICGKPGDGFDNYCRSCGALMDGGTNTLQTDCETRYCEDCKHYDDVNGHCLFIGRCTYEPSEDGKADE